MIICQEDIIREGIIGVFVSFYLKVRNKGRSAIVHIDNAAGGGGVARAIGGGVLHRVLAHGGIINVLGIGGGGCTLAIGCCDFGADRYAALLGIFGGGATVFVRNAAHLVCGRITNDGNNRHFAIEQEGAVYAGAANLHIQIHLALAVGIGSFADAKGGGASGLVIGYCIGTAHRRPAKGVGNDGACPLVLDGFALHIAQRGIRTQCARCACGEFDGNIGGVLGGIVIVFIIGDRVIIRICHTVICCGAFDGNGGFAAINGIGAKGAKGFVPYAIGGVVMHVPRACFGDRNGVAVII